MCGCIGCVCVRVCIDFGVCPRKTLSCFCLFGGGTACVAERVL